MYVKKGKDRLVLVFPILGIVIKFAVIRASEVLKVVFHSIKGGHWKLFVFLCKEWAPESPYVVSGLLFRGIVANNRERALWKRTHHSFLQPTIFSFFGLFNIQQYGKPYKSRHIDFWDQIRRITKGEAYINPHHFSEPCNYCVMDGKLRILDYGGHGSAWIVLKHGSKIADEFNFGFRYEESSDDNEMN